MTVQGKASTQKIFQIQNYKSIKHKQNGVEITHAFDYLHYSILIAIFIYDNINADTVYLFLEYQSPIVIHQHYFLNNFCHFICLTVIFWGNMLLGKPQQ